VTDHFAFRPHRGDGTVDFEYELLVDGDGTDIGVQDASAYGGGFVVFSFKDGTLTQHCTEQKLRDAMSRAIALWLTGGVDARQ
jgi:hypothetical protein